MSFLSILQQLSIVLHLITPFVFLAAALIWRYRCGPGWATLAYLGAAMACLAKIAHWVLKEGVTITNLHGLQLAGDTNLIEWLAYSVFLNIGYFVLAVALLGYFNARKRGRAG